MRVVLWVAHRGHLRNLESTIHRLEQRGHELVVVLDRDDGADLPRLPPSTRVERAVTSRVAPGVGIARKLRAAIDYLRFLDPPYRQSPAFRRRAAAAVPAPMRAPLALLARVGPRPRRLLRFLLRGMESRLPASTAVADKVRALSPDVVIVTPLIDLGGPQADVVRCSRRLGVPTVLAVASWDNLTTRGLIHATPDLVAVWNEAQRVEAMDLHRVSPERIVVTGAPAYDWWFARTVGSARDAFLRHVGLPDGPFLLYVCSSPFLAPGEARFVTRWVRAIRNANGFGAGVGLVVRPHPLVSDTAALGAIAKEGAVIWPAGGEDPVGEDARGRYYDSVFHASAVVGANTSAMVEGAILGKPLLTVLAPEFERAQREAVHFRHLADPVSGAVQVHERLVDHVAALGTVVELAEARSERAVAFARHFVRPHGLEREAASDLVDAVEGLVERRLHGLAPRP